MNWCYSNADAPIATSIVRRESVPWKVGQAGAWDFRLYMLLFLIVMLNAVGLFETQTLFYKHESFFVR